MPEAVVRVLIVDDQLPFRLAARAVVEMTDRFRVVGEAASGEEALEMVESLAPDLVLMDINLPGMNGIEATRHSLGARPGMVVVLVSTYEAGQAPGDAATSGALGYVHKERLTPELVEQLWDERATHRWRTA